MAWDGLGLLFDQGWRRPGPRAGIFAERSGTARIFAAPLVPLVKRARCCVTPHAIGATISHGITNLLAGKTPLADAVAWKSARPLSPAEILLKISKIPPSFKITQIQY